MIVASAPPSRRVAIPPNSGTVKWTAMNKESTVLGNSARLEMRFALCSRVKPSVVVVVLVCGKGFIFIDPLLRFPIQWFRAVTRWCSCTWWWQCGRFGSAGVRHEKRPGNPASVPEFKNNNHKRRELPSIASLFSPSNIAIRCVHLFIVFFCFFCWYRYISLYLQPMVRRSKAHCLCLVFCGFLFLPFSSAVVTWTELSHGWAREKKMGGVSFGSVELGRPVMDIFKRQKREDEKKNKIK